MATAQNSALSLFQDLLRQLFQFDTADLDFGLYRLLSLERDEVEAFLTEDLPRHVDEAFSSIATGEVEALELDLAKLAEEVRQAFGDDHLDAHGCLTEQFVGTRLGKQYEETRLALEEARQVASSTQGYREQVFNHLYAFFSRYYEDGDFIPRRRYGAAETYAVPYGGEEVFFHWATRDMHYIKTGERLRDYAFDVEALGQSYRVRFVLAEATVAKDNTKGDMRYFFPRPGAVSYDEATHELTAPFEYRLPTPAEVEHYSGTNSAKQDAILAEAVPSLLKAIPAAALAERLGGPAEEDNPAGPALLAKHLRHFTRRQTSDFFIHRDLRGFLGRELDFYLKDQVLQIEDLHGDFPAKRRLIEVTRELGRAIIEFLAQIEDAQKRLFEKRKFVLRTDYLCPVMHLPAEMWPEVLGNEAQQAAWAALFALDAPADLAFAQAHPTLVVDTRHFDEGFKLRLLVAVADTFGSIAEAIDGLLIHGENYQALRVLEPTYRGRVRCIYIDPPYNTDGSPIMYKNGYRSSTWTTLMYERLRAARAFLDGRGLLCVTIDDREQKELHFLLESVFGQDGIAGTVVIRANPSGRPVPSGLAVAHEYAIFARNSEVAVLGKMPRTEAQARRYGEEDADGQYQWELLRKRGSGSRRADRQSLYYPLYEREGRVRVPEMEWDEARRDWIVTEQPLPGEDVLWPVDEDGVQRRWRWSPEAVDRDTSQFMVKPGTRGEKVVYYKYRPRFDGVTVTTVWADPKYSATEHGTGVLKTLFPDYNVFSFPKSIYAVEDCLRIAAPDCGGECCLDFFAGSGTTGHAVINLNREDGERRQFVLVEMADYFDTVTVPRIAKVMYCPEWRDGRPDGYPAKPLSEGEWPEWVERTPRLVKVIRLESYEDTLHNLVTADTLARAEERQKATKTIVGAPTYRLQYLLKLPAEASGSLLLSEKLEHPFRYELEILTDAGPEVRGVDVVETFNFLYGLDVDRVERWEGAGREYRAVRARNRAGRQVLVLWRDMAGLTDGEASLPAVVAEREFLEGKIAELKAAGWVPDDTLINGDCAVPGITSLDGEFRRRMDEPEQ